ncbi:hypothetical protein ACLMJK_002681 [Lecanora helva]
MSALKSPMIKNVSLLAPKRVLLPSISRITPPMQHIRVPLLTGTPAMSSANLNNSSLKAATQPKIVPCKPFEAIEHLPLPTNLIPPGWSNQPLALSAAGRSLRPFLASCEAIKADTVKLILVTDSPKGAYILFSAVGKEEGRLAQYVACGESGLVRKVAAPRGKGKGLHGILRCLGKDGVVGLWESGVGVGGGSGEGMGEALGVVVGWGVLGLLALWSCVGGE